MKDFDDYEVNMGLKDIPNLRIIELDNGNKLRLTRKDPFGFIYLSLEKGGLPEAYKGAFTDWGQARLAAEKYQRERNETVKEAVDADKFVATPRPERPVLQLKQPKA